MHLFALGRGGEFAWIFQHSLTIHFLQGPGKIEGDKPFFEQLHVSHEARAYLENMQQVRKDAAVSKTLSRKEIEEKLETYIRVKGEAAVNAMRARARAIAPLLGMEKKLTKLNGLMSDLLGTGVTKNLQSGIARSRVLGEPLDPDRIELFEILYNELAAGIFPYFLEKNNSVRSYRNFAFFESYFSNYIEGTEFTVAEAKEIIATQTPLLARDEDSHDILGTYRIVSDKKEMTLFPTNPAHFLELLRERHAALLSARTSKKPGEFKDKNNRAGNTQFVDWQLVAGTLKKGFEWYVLLRNPFAKAIYIMFLISEVHPFLDGNGRVARVIMNAELSAQNLSKIIIPTVFRDDYIGALKKLTRQRIPDAYIRMMLRAYEFSSNIYGEDWDTMEQYHIAGDAFKEPKGKLKLIK